MTNINNKPSRRTHDERRRRRSLIEAMTVSAPKSRQRFKRNFQSSPLWLRPCFAPLPLSTLTYHLLHPLAHPTSLPACLTSSPLLVQVHAFFCLKASTNARRLLRGSTCPCSWPAFLSWPPATASVCAQQSITVFLLYMYLCVFESVCVLACEECICLGYITHRAQRAAH